MPALIFHAHSKIEKKIGVAQDFYTVWHFLKFRHSALFFTLLYGV